MATSRYHFAALLDSPSINPPVDKRDGTPRVLSKDEIAALYPGVAITLKPRADKSEQVKRMTDNRKAAQAFRLSRPRFIRR